MRVLVPFGLGLAIALALASQGLAATSKNILLVIADDYGADSSSLYNSTNTGASLPPTPNIVALAHQGVVYRNAYSNPVCSPTRACLLTGRYGFRTGIGDVVAGAGSAVLTASEFTLAEAFAANSGLGYQLAQFGKWHLNNGPASPNNIGRWPHFAGSIIGALPSYTDWTKTINGVSSSSANYATTDLVNDAVAWIQSQGAKPWFVWLAFNAPHSPLHKPPNSLCPHYASLSGSQADINAHPRAYFEAMCEAMDTELGRLLAAVDRTNTHIIFLGDNGTAPNVIQPPFPGNRAKDTLYEGGTHVPLIIAGPSVSLPGRTNETLVNMVDVFATILELAGIDLHATVPTSIAIDSQSLLPTLVSKTTLARYAYSELFGAVIANNVGGRALHNAQYKLIEFINGNQELYDLGTDPFESINLLSGALTPVQQSNYYSLSLRLTLYQTNAGPAVITAFSKSNTLFNLTVNRVTNVSYTLWRAPSLGDLSWAPVTNALAATNGTFLTLTDTNAVQDANFYLVTTKKP